jgi:hypothetical protein
MLLIKRCLQKVPRITPHSLIVQEISSKLCRHPMYYSRFQCVKPLFKICLAPAVYLDLGYCELAKMIRFWLILSTLGLVISWFSGKLCKLWTCISLLSKERGTPFCNVMVNTWFDDPYHGCVDDNSHSSENWFCEVGSSYSLSGRR